MAKFCTLCSSSSGNSTYIGHARGGILIDAGTNAKRLCIALNEQRIAPESIGAIFITHEHTDHISGLRVFANKYHIPVFASKGTLAALEKAGHLKGDFEWQTIPTSGIDILGINIKAFKTSHDSADSCGYSAVLPDERKISVVTDTGYVTDETYEAVRGSDLILLESNHDKGMLNVGPYPYHLKQRILSNRGHLSNEDCAKAACYFVNNGTTRLVLGHLSRENNTPRLAFETTYNQLGQMGAVENVDYILSVAPEGVGRGMVIL